MLPRQVMPLYSFVAIPCTLAFFALSAAANQNHRPFNWTLTQFDKLISFNVTAGAPSFTLPFCQLAGFRPKYQTANRRSFVNCEKPGPTREETIVSSATGFYICPASAIGCQDPTKFFCPSWGCETIAYGWRNPPNRDSHLSLLSTTSLRTNLAASITFSIKNPNDDQWLTGRTWGARLYAHGHHHGSLFTIQKRHATTATRPSAIGPNRVLNLPKAPPPPPSPPPLRSTSPTPSSGTPLTTASLSSHAPKPRLPPTQYSSPLIKLINASYTSLNTSYPNLTRNCWLCLSPSLPLYEPVATNLSFSKSSEQNPAECNWNASSVPLTFQSVSSTGHCVHSRRGPHPSLSVCSDYSSPDTTTRFLIPHNTSQWLCTSTGLTPCLNVATLDANNETCVLIFLAPRVLYHSDTDFFRRLLRKQTSLHLLKREPITAALTVASLLGLAGAGTGIAALATQSSALSSLRQAVDEDITYLREAVKYLKDSLNSLSEVVLQNRRGLDLLLLKEGGLCAALGEECCIYANSTGLVEDNLKKVEEGLEKRRKERENANYSSNLFHALLPYLLSFLGPLIVVILILTVGPWGIKRVLSIAKDQAKAVSNAVFSSFVQVHYQHLATDEPPPHRPLRPLRLRDLL
ncbi:alpha-N-acetylgalactosaminide alpha-2,6-sialyltransferase 3 isoform X2 [Dasypus novemcinctus]|uniref:alpha-N-acetylgalactosaminide alpha-2,6-sialyltransferase 3 isoform X2 n=1 Tax=Dasypus novemcinctus TaxID=9361 RepID=UPI00265F3AAD|nr:alpha-N-acetylgalactosaminide alpha-2,6-sialyltransferase 3 isoform X2 [Dasypus novemcinctus]XP_058159332.1 alpha-N-acetylgalactosaminide alpha-2,6-sialyltransferase 3 isoform X2 [Dasypus novemcinctus]